MLRAAAAFIVVLASLIAPASAGQPAGSAAWVVWDSTVYDGPGTRYDELGAADAGARIRVDRCSSHWCQIRGKDITTGWIPLTRINFGLGPHKPFDGPRLNYPSGGADVCFYTGAGFTGTSWCVPAGHVVRDAKLIGEDNTVSSIMLMAGAKVRVCRDRNFHSWCELVTESKSNLNGFLDNGVSSWQVY
jgi:uncharacterized protein YraI